MSTPNVNSIVDEPGTGSPDFPNGASVNGNPLPTAGSSPLIDALGGPNGFVDTQIDEIFRAAMQV
jgi:hypothetical protein